MNKNTKIIESSLLKRKRSEKYFKYFGLTGIISALLFLTIIITSIFTTGKKAFKQTAIKLEIFFDPKIIDPENKGTEQTYKSANYKVVIKNALLNYFPSVDKRIDIRNLTNFISSSEEEKLLQLILKDNTLIGTTKELWLTASSTVDVIHKNLEMLNIIEKDRLIDNKEKEWFNKLLDDEKLKFQFNKTFFTSADSTEPEQAGIWGSVMGSFFTLLVTLFLV